MKNKLQLDYEEMIKLFITNEDKYFSGNFLKEKFQLSTIKLQKIIHTMRLNSVPIVSSGKLGYKFTRNVDEIIDTYVSLKRRAESILNASNGMKHFVTEQGWEAQNSLQNKLKKQL